MNSSFFKATNNIVSPKWNNILNRPHCTALFQDFHGEICQHDKTAIVHAKQQYYWRHINCPVYELTGFFPHSYGSLIVSKRCKQKERVNQAYLRMQETGIIDRTSKKYQQKQDPLNNFQDRYSDKYNVQDEGVMFEHVKIIVICYFMFLPILLIILGMEIMIHKYKNRC